MSPVSGSSGTQSRRFTRAGSSTLGGRLLGVFWWTDTEAGPDTAYRVVYNGTVVALPKRLGMGSQGFRAVRDVPLPLG